MRGQVRVELLTSLRYFHCNYSLFPSGAAFRGRSAIWYSHFAGTRVALE